jgi:6-pyruvoyltetrahydropterin/6-carboxytetrahydropterin synthase
MTTCTKRLCSFPFAHRAHNHNGHCALIHGHNWQFDITFKADETDENGFVIDFGKLKPLKDDLARIFDHTLLINNTDPLARSIRSFLNDHHLQNVRMVDDCSCEGIAKLVYELTAAWVKEQTAGRVTVATVTIWESDNNYATYEPDIESE